MLGGPGAGKGTQATILADRLGLAHVASGDLFRQHLRDGTALGGQARRYIESVRDHALDEIKKEAILPPVHLQAGQCLKRIQFIHTEFRKSVCIVSISSLFASTITLLCRRVQVSGQELVNQMVQVCRSMRSSWLNTAGTPVRSWPQTYQELIATVRYLPSFRTPELVLE